MAPNEEPKACSIITVAVAKPYHEGRIPDIHTWARGKSRFNILVRHYILPMEELFDIVDFSNAYDQAFAPKVAAPQKPGIVLPGDAGWGVPPKR